MTAENDGTEPEGTDEGADTDQVAEYLSQLSQPGTLPSGTDGREPLPFEPSDVDFASNGWLARLAEVQAWLCLDEPFAVGDPQSAADDLFEQLSDDAPSACFRVTDGGVVVLTGLGRQHLETWLSRAIAHRQSFEEMLDEDRSPKDASDDWRQLWEEAASLSREPVAITAKVETWPTKYFVDHALEGLLDLNPSYQRDIVWSTSDSQTLIESLLRGIPLPSVILSEEANGSLQIVDGKQRLTAILRFLGKHPDGLAKATSMAGGQKLFEENFRKFKSKNHLKPSDVAANFFPFQLGEYEAPDPLARLSKKYYYEIKNEEIKIGEKKTNVAKLFESVSSDYKIPIIIYSGTRIRDIHHVFALYNKQGRKLNAEELRNATHHHLEVLLLLLVLSGDRFTQIDDLAPYLPADLRIDVANTGNLLQSLGFGVARFKRAKVLSWVLAVLMHAPNRSKKKKTYTTPSTTSHINSMLDHVSKIGDHHWLFQRNNLVLLAKDISKAVTLHREHDAAWHPKFRRREEKQAMASKWEELPLVASLLATQILCVVGAANAFVEKLETIRNLVGELRAPKKTQNRDQWQHIARVVTALLQAVGCDEAEIDRKLEDRYGYSCMHVLRELAGQAPAAQAQVRA